MKFVAVIFVLALFVQDNEAWRRRRRRRTFPSCRPRNCEVSVWSQWSSCPCGSSGTRTRTRRIILPAACGGLCFFHLLESQFCKRDCQNSGTPTLNGCVCPPGYLGTCCEIAVPLTTKGEMQTTVNATNRTPPPRSSATIPRSRLTPQETSASEAPTLATTRTRQTAIRTEQLNPATVSTEQLPQSNATARITATTPRTRSTAASSAITTTLATTGTRQTAIKTEQLNPATASTEQLPQSNATARITATTPRTRSTAASSAITTTLATTGTRQTAIKTEQLNPATASTEQLPQSNATARITATTPRTRSTAASSAITTTLATTGTRQTAIKTEQLNPATVSTGQLPQSNATARITATTPRTRSTAASSAITTTLATTGTRQTAIKTEQLNPAVSTDQLPQSNATRRITAMTPRTRSTAASSAIAPTSATTRTRQTAIRTEQLNPLMVSTEELPQSNATRRVTATTPRRRSTAASSAIPPTPSSAFGGMNATQPTFTGFPSATLQPTTSSASGVVDATSSSSSQVPTQQPFTGCGGLLNSRSGTFASPGYPFSYSNNLNCLWTLRIPTDSVLSLQFERFNTEQCCDFVELTVSTGRLATVSGSRNGFSITVRGDRSPVLNIRFTTDRSVVRQGFFARYIIILGFPSATLRPTPSSASEVVDATPSPSSQVATQPPFTGCGGLLNSTRGTFASPGYPFSYSNNLNCLWTLRIPTDSVLSLQFERFNTEQCCDFVELTVSTGRLATLSGSRTGFRITVSGDRSPVLNITFTTDRSVVRQGFFARYIIIFGFPSATLRPTPSSASGVVDVTSSPSSQVPTQPPFTGCGGLLNSTRGTFASPGYPFSYSNNLNCLWTLRIPTDSVLSLQFERFNTEQCCDFVELTVSTGRLARLSGFRNGFSITVRGDRSPVLNITFTTDRSVVRPGFFARYIIIFGFPSATLRPTPSSASGVVDVTSSLSSQVPSQPPFTRCGGLLNSTRGTFASPGYPFSYSNNLNCLWTLRIPTDSILSLQFERFNTEHCCDFVELTVSTGRLARLSGSRNGFSITVRGDRSPVLNITFTTDRFVVRPGFFARYIIIFGFPSATLRPTPSSASGVVDVTSSPSSQVPTQPPFTGCGGQLNSTSGTFASPGYPFSYFNNLNCLWTLRIPTDSVLSLQFERFNTEQCCDFVELTVSTGRLARLSDSRNGFNITVRGDRSRVLNIRFTTDRSVVTPGFLAHYIIIFVPRPTSFTPFNNVTLPNTARPPSNTPFVTLPTEVRRVLTDLLISLTRIILRLQGLIRGQLTNEAFENFRNDTLQILQRAEMQLERPSNRHLGKRAIHELPDPEELAQIMDEIQRRLLG